MKQNVRKTKERLHKTMHEVNLEDCCPNTANSKDLASILH